MGRLSHHKRFALVVASVLLVTGAAVAVWGFDSPFWEWNSKIKIERDRQPRWQVDPDQPYEISWWASSPMSDEGEKITIRQDGGAVWVRGQYVPSERGGRSRWERADFTVTAESRAQVLAAIKSNELMKLHRSYDRTDTFDGFWKSVSIKQGEHEKIVSCRNHFPESFERFGQQLTTIVSRYNHELKWQEVERFPR
jgi:hypothetical protein